MQSKEIDAHFDREAGPVWRELRGGLWHSTGSHRLRKILEAGEIQPKPDLAPSEFKWAELGTTFCRDIGGVSLFDFANADWEWLFENNHAHRWTSFLKAPVNVTGADTWVSTAWLAVERERLVNFVPLKDAFHDWKSGDTRRKWMPHIEACHKGAISLSACSHAVVVCAVNPVEFQRIALHPFDSAQLDSLESGWRRRFSEEYAARKLSPRERLLRAPRQDGR